VVKYGGRALKYLYGSTPKSVATGLARDTALGYGVDYLMDGDGNRVTQKIGDSEIPVRTIPADNTRVVHQNIPQQTYSYEDDSPTKLGLGKFLSGHIKPRPVPVPKDNTRVIQKKKTKKVKKTKRK
jgi:hypothetical protein